MLNKIEDILNDNISIEDKIKIIEEHDKDNFKSLETIDLDIIESIQKEIRKAFIQSKKNRASIENEIGEIKEKISKFKIGINNYDSPEEYKNAIIETNEKLKEKAKKELEKRAIDSFLEKNNSINNKIKDILIDSKKNNISSSIHSSNIKIQKIMDDIKNLEGVIGKREDEIQALNERNDALNNLINNFNINSNPLTDAEIDILIEHIDQITDNNNVISKYEFELEKYQENLAKLEYDLKQEQKILENQERVQEKSQEREEELNKTIEEFNELYSKDSLNKFELVQLKSLYKIINSSNQLKSKEKENIFIKYITAYSINKKDDYTAEIKRGINFNGKIKDVSKLNATIAKGKIATIKLMQKSFEKLAEVKQNVEKSVNELKINSYGKVIDFLNAKKEYLERKQINDENEEMIEIEPEDINETRTRVIY